MTRCRGKALFLDLGFGRRQLMALLAKAPANQNHGDHKIRWGECSPFNVLAHLYGEAFADYGPDGKSIWKLVRYRGPRDVEPSSENLPCLVTFADMNDSKCVQAVDPGDLEATLGPGEKWHRATLQITDEPVTTGIEEKQWWMDKYRDPLLDGHKPGQQGDGSFASRMNTNPFREGTQ